MLFLDTIIEFNRSYALLYSASVYLEQCQDELGPAKRREQQLDIHYLRADLLYRFWLRHKEKWEREKQDNYVLIKDPTNNFSRRMDIRSAIKYASERCETVKGQVSALDIGLKSISKKVADLKARENDLM